MLQSMSDGYVRGTIVCAHLGASEGWTRSPTAVKATCLGADFLCCDTAVHYIP